MVCQPTQEFSHSVIPALAGIQRPKYWIPAGVGTATGKRRPLHEPERQTLARRGQLFDNHAVGNRTV
jgi:hypothetical protein